MIEHLGGGLASQFGRSHDHHHHHHRHHHHHHHHHLIYPLKAVGEIQTREGQSPRRDHAAVVESGRGSDHPPPARVRHRGKSRSRQNIHQKSHDSHLRTQRAQGEDGLFAEEEVYQRPGKDEEVRARGSRSPF